jgi:glycosyltransferase involved in cell wall biosynthesis
MLDKINDPRIRIVHNDAQKYCSSSYAVALSHATGDIVGILDGDDFLRNDAMKVIIKRYTRHPEIQFIYTQHYWCNANLASQRSGVSSAPKKGKSLAEMTQAGRHCFSHWRTFRREMASKGVLFPEGLQVSVDKNLGFSLEELGKGAFLPKKLYYYRYYKGNMSLVQGGNQKRTTKQLSKKFLKKRKAHNRIAFPIVTIA